MNLADLDRPLVTWHYDPWQRDIVLRAISAREWITLQPLTDGDKKTMADHLRFNSELLALCVVDPKCTADEWMEVRRETLQELIEEVLRVNALDDDTAKKN